jgi:hypothetical protein
MTPEDETGDRQLRARENTMHEIGLFSDNSGFLRTIVIAERGVES